MAQANRMKDLTVESKVTYPWDAGEERKLSVWETVGFVVVLHFESSPLYLSTPGAEVLLYVFSCGKLRYFKYCIEK